MKAKLEGFGAVLIKVSRETETERKSYEFILWAEPFFALALAQGHGQSGFF